MDLQQRCQSAGRENGVVRRCEALPGVEPARLGQKTNGHANASSPAADMLAHCAMSAPPAHVHVLAGSATYLGSHARQHCQAEEQEEGGGDAGSLGGHLAAASWQQVLLGLVEGRNEGREAKMRAQWSGKSCTIRAVLRAYSPRLPRPSS